MTPPMAEEDVFPTVDITEEEKRVQGRTEYMKQILPAVPPRQVFTT